MSIEQHPLAQLSAYLDEALAPAERAVVASHLDMCAACRARLTELRATASLIGQLVDPMPTRRLVPRVAAGPSWLAPLRTLSTVASGLSVFVFLATSLLSLGSASGSASTAAEPARIETSASGAPAAGFAASPAPAAPQASSRAAQSVSPAALNAADSAKAIGPSPSTAAQGLAGRSQPAEAAGQRDTASARLERGAGPVLTSPWLWLALAVAFGVIALGLQRRLRSS